MRNNSIYRISFYPPYSRPVMGKTSFSISLTISLTEQSRKCIYFSAEWKEQQLVKNINFKST